MIAENELVDFYNKLGSSRWAIINDQTDNDLIDYILKTSMKNKLFKKMYEDFFDYHHNIIDDKPELSWYMRFRNRK